MTQSRPFVSRAAALTAPIVQPHAPPAFADLNGCPWHDVKAKLREVGLRPTRQRMALGWILFAKGDRHVTAEMLYEEANHAKVPVSLATVYNTLHQFTEVGLLRQVAIEGSKAYFDTNNSAASPLLHRGQKRSHRHSRRPRWRSARRRRRRKATRSPASTWWCGCGASGADPSHVRHSGEPERRGPESITTELAERTRSADPYPLWRWIPGSRLGAPRNDEERLLDLLVRIDAPQPLLFDPAVEAVAGEPAPAAVAMLDRSEHSGLQTGQHRAFGIGLGMQRRQIGL